MFGGTAIDAQHLSDPSPGLLAMIAGAAGEVHLHARSKDLFVVHKGQRRLG